MYIPYITFDDIISDKPGTTYIYVANYKVI